MKINPQDPLQLDLLASDLVRHPGLHASHIYGSLYEELEPKRFVRGSKPDPLRMALGTAWEAHLEYLLIKNGVAAERPPAFISPSGVAYSPDLLIYEADKVIVGEIKLTWMSSKDAPRLVNAPFPPKYDKWLTQAMVYAYWLETTFVRLYAMFVNGSHYAPELLVWDIEFHPRELIENHDRLMNHAKHRGMM